MKKITLVCKIGLLLGSTVVTMAQTESTLAQ